MTAVSISNRQYYLIEQAKRKGGITLGQMLATSQTTGGSVVRQNWLHWSPRSKRFVLTTGGLAVWESYQDVDITRANIKRPLSVFIREDGYKRKQNGKEAR